MENSSNTVIFAALAANLFIAVTKFIAAGVTGSSSILAEAIHSLVDTSNELLLLYGLRRAKLPPDDQFPFGHGKEVYFWSFVVAILVFAVGSGLSIYQGVDHLLYPRRINHPFVIYLVLGMAALFEGSSWNIARREFDKRKGRRGYFEAIHRGKDPSVFVVFLEDSAALFSLGVAFIGISLSLISSSTFFDALASVIIGLILGITASILAAETKSLLIGESANREVIQGIREIVNALDSVERVNEILTMHMGPEFIVVNLCVEFADFASADDIETQISSLERRIKKTYPKVKRIFVESRHRRMGDI